MKSEGKQERSYCYVADCATALLTILLAGATGQAFNIANKDSIITIRSMAELIADACGRKIVVAPPSSPASSGYSTVSRSVLNASKLEGLGWQALFSMEQGIKQTVSILMNKAF
ncbi:GDP-L-fucose synthase [compost metagenome]